jgi:uncharacterized repeat protein (TIGR03803 family)
MPASLALGLIVAAGLIPGSRLAAQTFTVLHRFTANDVAPFTNSDGSFPYGGVVLAGSSLYGTTRDGGEAGSGTIFKVNTDGTPFVALYSFTQSGATDGANPTTGVTLVGNALYGTAKLGGAGGNGTIFTIGIDGSGFSVLHRFTGADGAAPRGLTAAGDTLYGIAQMGGKSGNGTVFTLRTDGTGFTNLHHFTAISGALATNSDGAAPYRELLLACDTLYGSAHDGGAAGNGTIFKLNTNGTGFTTLYHFSTNAGPFRPNGDGAKPYDGLVMSGDTLYGTAADGGATANGTIFKLKTDGTGFRVLYEFSAVPDEDNPPFVNADGATPVSGLVLAGNTLYGTTQVGGSLGAGTLFAINIDGTGFTSLHSFAAGEGTNPNASLTLSGNTFYGTASSIFASSINMTDFGTVFSLSLEPKLNVNPSSPNVVLTWPTDYAGFDYTQYTLESAATLGSGAAWSAVSPVPVAVNGWNTVTRTISGTQQYYRLRQVRDNP